MEAIVYRPRSGKKPSLYHRKVASIKEYPANHIYRDVRDILLVMERDPGISSSMAMLSIRGAKSIYILTKIVGAELDSQALLSETGLTKKALYIRLSRLLNVGIVTRRNGKYSLTSFGKIVYHAQDLIATALNNYWRLSALDSLTMLDGLPTTEYLNICKKLLNDQRIKKALSQNAGQTENNQSAVCMNQIFIRTKRAKNHKGEFVEA